MNNMLLLGELFDKKTVNVLRFFILNKEKEFYLNEIVKETKVPLATVYRLILKLKDLAIVEEIRIKRFKLYKCLENDHTNFLESFLKEGKKTVELFAEMASKLENVQEIILYGNESEDKANLLLIGPQINNHALKQLTLEFREKYNYHITALNLEREQYNQMSNMGLYSSNKKTLWKS